MMSSYQARLISDRNYNYYEILNHINELVESAAKSGKFEISYEVASGASRTLKKMIEEAGYTLRYNMFSVDVLIICWR